MFNTAFRGYDQQEVYYFKLIKGSFAFTYLTATIAGQGLLETKPEPECKCDKLKINRYK
jgi:hypothetical protein